jgi:hypothetical protein
MNRFHNKAPHESRKVIPLMTKALCFDVEIKFSFSYDLAFSEAVLVVVLLS